MKSLKALLKRISQQRKEDYPFPEDLETYLDNFFPHDLMKHDTLQKTFKISSNELERIYKEAYEEYLQANYKESIFVFRWLVFFNPFISKFWFALAASLQMEKNYKKALHAYSVSAILRPEDPYAHYYAYVCYTMLNDYEEANKALELAWIKCQKNPIYEELKEEILMLKQR